MAIAVAIRERCARVRASGSRPVATPNPLGAVEAVAS